MRPSWFGLTLALSAAWPSLASAQVDAFPRYADAVAVDADCRRLMDDQQRARSALQRMPAEGGVAPLVALDEMLRRGDDTLGPLDLLASVHPVKALRDAAEACTLGYQAFSSEFLQDPKVHALLAQSQPADEIDRRMQRDQLDAFEDSGVALPPDRQARARAIATELTRLAQEFERRIREDRTLVPFTTAELRGVPASVWRGAKRDAHGRVLLGLDDPTSVPVIEQAHSAAARERMWRATMAQGGLQNLAVLAQLAELRREYAQLFGFASYADFVLRRRMVRNAAAAEAFLGDVQRAVADREQRDLAALRAAKARHLGTDPAATVVQRWDLAYYAERVRQQRHRVEQDRLRRHFPPEASLRFVFGLAERLFGVRFEPRAEALWHADARRFDAVDVASARVLGTLYVDLYPRADKYGGAAVWPFRNASTLAGRKPAAALVVNFDRKGLNLEELETLLHEFGHALHTLLSTTRYNAQGGTNVLHDFAEAPSQMLEDWVYDPRVLALVGEVCARCPPVPPQMIERAEQSRRFARGILFARQALFARYDLALHGSGRHDPMALWASMEGATPVGHVPGSMFPAGFSHIAGGYAAGYYGYLWSLVVAEDLRTAFAADRLDPAAGRRYRDTVLANGGQVEPDALVARFLGRAGNSQAFFRALDRE
jgi:thimet oligopeptidase